MKLFIMQFVHSPVTSSLLGPNILLVFKIKLITFKMEQHESPTWQFFLFLMTGLETGF
jgi:hypothetical protein